MSIQNMDTIHRCLSINQVDTIYRVSLNGTCGYYLLLHNMSFSINLVNIHKVSLDGE